MRGEFRVGYVQVCIQHALILSSKAVVVDDCGIAQTRNVCDH